MKTFTVLALVWLLLSGSPILAGVLFTNVDETVINSEIKALVMERISKTSGRTQNLTRVEQIDQTIVAKGTNAVPILIAMAQEAANTDPLVLGQGSDYGNALRCPVDLLATIGDRRAIPLLIALMKFDDKPARMHNALCMILCHGTDEQIATDAKSNDQNLARAAQLILRYPVQFQFYKDKYRSK
jgi:hypothetical protein